VFVEYNSVRKFLETLHYTVVTIRDKQLPYDAVVEKILLIESNRFSLRK